jgi:hypothetical protein
VKEWGGAVQGKHVGEVGLELSGAIIMHDDVVKKVRDYLQPLMSPPIRKQKAHHAWEQRLAHDCCAAS